MSDPESVSCARLELGEQKVLFVKGKWLSDHFSLAVFDGQDAWSLNATVEQVASRAEGWDKAVSEYIDICRKHLGQNEPASNYEFSQERDGAKLSFETSDKYDTVLKGIWRLKRESNSERTVVDLLNHLLDANEVLRESAARAQLNFDNMKVEAEKTLQQCERFKDAKKLFEDEVYHKFVAILNAKKAKLRELQNAAQNVSKANCNQEDEDMVGNQTDSEDEGSDSDTESGAGARSPLFNSQDFCSHPAVPEAESSREASHDRDASEATRKSPLRLAGGHEMQSETAADADDMAAALLSTAPDYTSAPRRRRCR